MQHLKLCITNLCSFVIVIDIFISHFHFFVCGFWRTLEYDLNIWLGQKNMDFFYSAYYLILLGERQCLCVCMWIVSNGRLASRLSLSLIHTPHTHVDVVYINDHLAHTHTDGAEKDVEGVWGGIHRQIWTCNILAVCMKTSIYLSHTVTYTHGIGTGIPLIGSSNRFKTLFMI